MINLSIYLATLLPILFVYLITTEQITVGYGMAFMVAVNACIAYIVSYNVKRQMVKVKY